jgi:hypothetical protein
MGRSVIGGSVSTYQVVVAADWWLAGSAVDLDFEDGQYYDSSVGIGTDPNLATTVLMLHGNGADGSSNISDSARGHFVTVGGNAQIDTAQSKFGGASILFDGSGDYLALDGSSDFTFGTGDFTIDFWARWASVSGHSVIFGNGAGFRIYREGTSNHVIFDGGAADVVGTTGLVINTWYHIAVTRSGTSVRLFIDGTQEGSTTTDSTNYSVGGALSPTIGIDPDLASHAQNGWMEDIRILKGTAAWTANFTPPAAPYDVGIGPYDMLSISRASTGYAQTSSGTLTTFAANQLRITDQGLLVEDARTNYSTRSQEFDNASWTKDQTVATADQAVAPDGTTTMDKVVEDTTSANHRWYQTAQTHASNPTMTFSLFVKDIDRRYCGIYAGGGAYCTADLQTGTIVSSGQSGGLGTFVSAGIEAFGNGIYRINVVGTPGSGVTNEVIILYLSNAGGGPQPSYLGTSKGIYAWGMQLEVGAFASSYIPTTTAALARAADAVLTAGTLNGITAYAVAQSGVADMIVSDPSGISTYNVLGDDGAVNGYMHLGFSDTTNKSRNYSATGILESGTFAAGSRTTGVKIGYSHDSNGRSIVGGGGTVTSDADAVTAFHNNITSLGINNGVGSPIYGYYRRLTIWSSRLADATLQGFTNP